MCAALLCAGVLRAQPMSPSDMATGSLPAAAGSDFRPELSEALPPSRLIGKGRLTVWGFPVYELRLWAASGFSAARYSTQALALELAYLRDFDAADIAKRSIQEMRRSAAISDLQAATWTADLLRVIPSVKKGDRILGVNQPGVGAAFWLNGKAHGEIRDVEFARLFFGIWLSPKTSEPQLRDTLLGGSVE